MENLTSKKIVDRKKELIFIFTTITILLFLLLLSFFSMRFLFQKGEELFAREGGAEDGPVQFNFQLYEELFNPQSLESENLQPVETDIETATSSVEESPASPTIDSGDSAR
ncbi:MAG: hypothetical protein Q8P45_03475 [Candidatus Harrisonbacteria bacterium]|nr:hypothetical protein [Candidatus Harrisonbacteria bacterium]